MEYDLSWPRIFEVEMARLGRLFGDAAAGIHHIGSTSVPGLASKPIIDVLIESPGLELVDARSHLIEADGLEARGEHGIPGRRYFVGRTASGGGLHVHVFDEASPGSQAHLLFRDYLRTHPEEASRYEKLKRELARNRSLDRTGYQKGKAGFIEDRCAKAKAWAKRGRPTCKGAHFT
jgi:GrpB-like predicted nucleotidyltransferase (UPF0157 family)